MADDYIHRSPSESSRNNVRRSGSSRPTHSSGNTSSQGVRRSGSSARPTSSRSAGTHSSRMYSSVSRSNSNPSRRRSAKRRKRRSVQPRFLIFIVIAVIIVIALAVILSGRSHRATVSATPSPAPMTGASNVEIYSTADEGTTDETEVSETTSEQTTASDSTSLSEQLDDSDSEVAALDESDRIQVSAEELSVNTTLPDEWINVLLLGTDERVPNDAARTDAIIICSINKNTGRVKLTSIARDTAVAITGTKKYDGTYRINALNFFGGPNYVMKYLNEKLNLNIQYYVTVNFFGFQKIATALGGIDVDISEAEMEEINKKQISQARNGYEAGLDESDLENVLLTTYGKNTHLNGRQTLAYARVRYVDSDMSRMERQRTVLVKLMEKLRGKSTSEIVILASSLFDCVTTNMELNSILDIAMTVLNNVGTDVDSLRIPVNGSFVEERRNDKDMLYDTDWETNANELYNFIYVT